jgi:hypothetical protein
VVAEVVTIMIMVSVVAQVEDAQLAIIIIELVALEILLQNLLLQPLYKDFEAEIQVVHLQALEQEVEDLAHKEQIVHLVDQVDKTVDQGEIVTFQEVL